MIDMALVIVDMQNDFIDGSLGTKEAVEIVPNVVKLIDEWKGDFIFTKDTHHSNYLSTAEGRKLPVEHCIEDTVGWDINTEVYEAVLKNLTNHEFPRNRDIEYIRKQTFGSLLLPEYIREFKNYDLIEIVGLCTDICVISTALILKAYFPEAVIMVKEKCCAGTTPEKHKAAIEVLKSCQIEVV